MRCSYRFSKSISYQLMLAESVPRLNSAMRSLDDVPCTLIIVPYKMNAEEVVHASLIASHASLLYARPHNPVNPLSQHFDRKSMLALMKLRLSSTEAAGRYRYLRYNTSLPHINSSKSPFVLRLPYSIIFLAHALTA